MRTDAPQDRHLQRGVDGRKCVVEHENPWRTHEGAREREPLALPARDRETAIAEHRVETVWQFLDHLARPGGVERRPQRFVRGAVGRAEKQVLPNAAAEEERILRDHAHGATQVDRVGVRDRDSVERGLPGIAGSPAGQQPRQRGLT